MPTEGRRHGSGGGRRWTIWRWPGEEGWRLAIEGEDIPSLAEVVQVRDAAEDFKPVSSEGLSEEGKRIQRWTITKWPQYPDSECSIEGPDTPGRIEVVPASRVDELSAEIERLREALGKQSEFARRAAKTLVGIAGAESHDEDAIDRARSLILAAYDPALHPTEETEGETG